MADRQDSEDMEDIQEEEAPGLVPKTEPMEGVEEEDHMEGTSEAKEGSSEDLPPGFRTGLLDDESDSEEEWDDHDDEASPSPHSYSPDEESEDDYDDAPTIEAIVNEVTRSFNNYARLLSLMMGRGLLPKSQKCPKCNRRMILQKHNYVTGKEWKCPSASKSSECSTVSVKRDSWFQEADKKLTLKTVTHFLIMFTKKSSHDFIKSQLSMEDPAFFELLVTFLGLVERIINNYEAVGGTDKEVYLEVITVGKPYSRTPTYRFLAGYEYGSSNCFVRLLTDDKVSTMKRVKKTWITEGSEVHMNETPFEEIYEQQYGTIKHTDIPDESAPYMFFRSLREPVPEAIYLRGPEVIQNYLNDEVVRRVEGLGYLNACFKEIINYI